LPFLLWLSRPNSTAQSNRLNCIHIPSGADDDVVRRRLLEEYGIEIGGGFGVMAGKAWLLSLRYVTAFASLRTKSRRLAHNWRGFRIPSGVMMPVINSAGVTSKPGFKAPLVGLATRT
jgi:hypothetical protein